jgi:hypothetical protein
MLIIWCNKVHLPPLIRTRKYNKVYSVNYETKTLDKVNSSAGRYKACPELRLGGPFIRYRIKGSPKYQQLLVSLVAANVVTAMVVDYFVKISLCAL